MTRLILRAVLIAVVVAGCAQEPPWSPPPTPTEAPSPSAAQASASPCSPALLETGALTRQLADTLVALRPTIVSKPFHPADAVPVIRRASAVFTNYDGIDDVLATCPQAGALTARVDQLRTDAQDILDVAQAASITDAATQRDAGARLMALLPEVMAISSDVQTIASDLGIEVAAAVVPPGATEPIDGLTPVATASPEPTPVPTPSGRTALSIEPSFFGGGVRISGYKVRGSTPSTISHSIATSGPYQKWLGGTAAATTHTSGIYDFHLSTASSGGCSIVIDSEPPVHLAFTIVLPSWKAPRAASTATIRWWNNELRDIATHEKHHVELYRAATLRLIDAVRTSTCDSIEDNLGTVWKAAQRENCEFDMKEYGQEQGLSLKACLAAAAG